MRVCLDMVQFLVFCVHEAFLIVAVVYFSPQGMLFVSVIFFGLRLVLFVALSSLC